MGFTTFHRLSSLLFIFPSQYLFTIGFLALFRLARRIPGAFTHYSQSALLKIKFMETTALFYAAFTLSGRTIISFKEGPNLPRINHTLQRPKSLGLVFALFIRHYWGHRCCFLFLPLIRCFNSRGYPKSLMLKKRPCEQGKDWFSRFLLVSKNSPTNQSKHSIGSKTTYNFPNHLVWMWKSAERFFTALNRANMD